MWLFDVFCEPVWQRLTWNLLHFLWQGLVVAAALVALIWLFRVRQAQVRYGLCLIAMVVMVACPVVTFTVMEVGIPKTVASGSAGAELTIGHFSEHQAALSDTTGAASDSSDSVVAWRPQLADYARATQPYLLIGWIAGVCLLSARLLLSCVGTHWLRRGRHPIPAELASCVSRLGRRLGLRSGPNVSASERIREAIVVGFLRPMVLLPASWLVEMTPEVLEAVIAHELAHIRRWDLWANLFQRLVETLLFYHPAVWWLSRRVRLEREMCCDELAVAVTGKRAAYATALELVARRRLTPTKPVLAAAMGDNRMLLLNRIRHILGLTPSHERGRWWPVGLLGLIVPLAIWLASTGIAHFSQEEARAEEKDRLRAASVEADEKNAMAALKQLGARLGLDELSNKGRARWVAFSGTQVTDADLEHLKPLTRLEELHLDDTEVSDAGLVQLKTLTNLRSLDLRGTQVTDAGLTHLSGLTQLESLKLHRTKVTDAGLEYLKRLTELKLLNLRGTQVTDAGLERLKGLPKLEVLDLFDTQVTDTGLVQLEGLINLRYLSLGNTQVTGAGLVHLERLTKLDWLCLSGTQVSDASLEYLKGLVNLKCLYLSNTPITDAGLVHLKTLAKLDDLYLGGTQVGDAGLVQLKGLIGLKHLYLTNTQVTDTGLMYLKGLPRLQFLRLAGTRVTEEGVKKLKQALPNIIVERNDKNAVRDKTPDGLAGPFNILGLAPAMKAARESARRARQAAESLEGDAVKVSLGRFVLIRRGKDYIALKFTEHTNTGDGGAKYEWHWQGDGTGDFSKANVQKGTGEVFEKYKSIIGTLPVVGRMILKDDGSQLLVKCGPLTLQWSYSSRNSDWLYFSGNREADISVAVTGWDKLADVDVGDPGLKWVTKRKTEN